LRDTIAAKKRHYKRYVNMEREIDTIDGGINRLQSLLGLQPISSRGLFDEKRFQIKSVDRELRLCTSKSGMVCNCMNAVKEKIEREWIARVSRRIAKIRRRNATPVSGGISDASAKRYPKTLAKKCSTKKRVTKK
jgi:hypothetical protein